jgi:Domain of unknown function (DUF892)
MARSIPAAPGNEGGDGRFVEAPALQDMVEDSDVASIQAQSADPAASETIQQLLVDQLRDLSHAEKQLLKALPKMAQAARFVPAGSCSFAPTSPSNPKMARPYVQDSSFKVLSPLITEQPHALHSDAVTPPIRRKRNRHDILNRD